MNISFISSINKMLLAKFHEWELRLTWVLMGLKLTWYKTEITKLVKKIFIKLPIFYHTNGLQIGNVCAKLSSKDSSQKSKMIEAITLKIHIQISDILTKCLKSPNWQQTTLKCWSSIYKKSIKAT
jgi:hypothetical protein